MAQKLYTEEQVKEMLSMTDMIMYGDSIPNNDILASFTPIELPSDEEIDMKIEDSNYSLEFDSGFRFGVQWMRDKILNK